MKKYILSILLVGMITSVGFAQADNMGEEIIKKERAMYEAVQKGDMSVFEDNLLDDFIAIYSHGISNKEEEIANLENVNMTSFELSNINVMSPTENVAIIVYEVNSSGEYMGEPFSGTFFSSSIWTMQDGEWKALMHTETRSEPAEATAEMMDDDWTEEMEVHEEDNGESFNDNH